MVIAQLSIEWILYISNIFSAYCVIFRFHNIHNNLGKVDIIVILQMKKMRPNLSYESKATQLLIVWLSNNYASSFMGSVSQNLLLSLRTNGKNILGPYQSISNTDGLQDFPLQNLTSASTLWGSKRLLQIEISNRFFFHSFLSVKHLIWLSEFPKASPSLEYKWCHIYRNA